MINDQAFDGMKDDMILVNVARGPIVNDEALVRALDSGKGMRPLCYPGWMLIIVRRTALDVFTNEPEIHPGLINDYRVVSLPPTNSIGFRLMADTLTTLCCRPRPRLC